MNYATRKYPQFAVCGLNCGLCPRHYTTILIIIEISSAISQSAIGRGAGNKGVTYGITCKAIIKITTYGTVESINFLSSFTPIKPPPYSSFSHTSVHDFEFSSAPHPP
ncbi:MAG: hypothetical protein FWH20_07110 [Oscillospiraceae bacterium]|nr:hypothetical protein [Oscillospiraceae bacterium]